MARDYSTFPGKICGHRCSRYEKDQLCQILNYYRQNFRKSWSKDRLLERLVIAEGRLTEEEKAIVQRWMSQRPKAPQPFSQFVAEQAVKDARGDLPLAIPTKKRNIIVPSVAVSSTAIDCIVCMESLESDNFPKHKITPSCGHQTTTCTSCLAQAIESQILDVPWDQIKCPECPELLDFASVKQAVSPQAFERHDIKSTP